MLRRRSSLISFHAQAITHSLNLLSRRPLATIMTVIVIAITLALPAFFWVFTDNLSQLTNGWQKGGHISLYLKLGLTEAEQKTVLNKVGHIPGVGQVVLKSSSDGLAELTQQEGMQDIMRYLPANPLPPVIEVVPMLGSDSPAKLDLLSRQLGALSQVAQVKLDLSWISRLHVILDCISQVARALMCLLAFAVILIIGNTLRLSIHSRSEEIRVLKLIGAKDSFILRPFLYSGLVYGIAGAVGAVFLVNIMMLSLGFAVNQLVMTYQMHYSLVGMSIKQVLLLLVFAMILGWLGARLSVKRQLSLFQE